MATSDEVLTDVLLLCGWPALADNPPLGASDLLLLCDHVIKGQMWPDILAAQGDYYLDYLDHDITTAQSRYRLPRRSYGPIKDVLFIDDGDDEDEAESVPFMNVEELGRGHISPRNRNRYIAFIDGDFLGLSPIPTETRGTLRIRYYRQPNKMVLLATCAQITARADVVVLGVPVDQLSLDTDLDPLYAASIDVDIIAGGNAHQWLDGRNAAIGIGVAGVVISAGRWADAVGVGDYLAPANQTPVAQVPESMLPLLVESVALRALHHEGDERGFARVAGMAGALAKKSLGTLDPRSEAEPKLIVPRDTPLRLAGGFRTGRGW